MIGRFCIVAVMALAASMLASCSGSQTRIAPGTIPQLGSSLVPQAASGSSYTSLHSFGVGSDGRMPRAGLIDVRGALYGTTYRGGARDTGTIFKISTSGTEKVVYSFRGKRDGANPSASLIYLSGVFYGTTEYGPNDGGCNAGTVFSVSTTGAERVLHRFYGYYCHDHTYSDGENPVASLIDVKGRLYGTTYIGGFYECCGTIFRISTSGREKVLYSFEPRYGAGTNPGANLLNVKGTLYGTSAGGGNPTTGFGTVFSTSTTGTVHVLYSFYPDPSSLNGCSPAAGLINVKGTLYGTTEYCSTYNRGTAFSITMSGQLTSLHTFGSGSDGSSPAAALLNVSGKLYGTTSGGGAYGGGTVFRINPRTSTEAILHSFGHGSDGATPLGALVDVNGRLYGTTSAGGTYGKGTVFALTP